MPPSATELARLYKDAGWLEAPALEGMQRVLNHPSEWVVGRNGEGRLLGMGRMLTDYARYAFLIDVIVERSYQGEGIGTAIVRALLAECESIGIDSVHLWPSKGLVPFYERLGFKALPAEQPHMKWEKI